MIVPVRTQRGMRYRVRINNGPQRTFSNRKDAEEFEADQRRAQRREQAGLEPNREPITYRQLVELYQANFTPSEWQERMIQYSLDRWGSTMVRSIQPEALGAWLHGLKKKGGEPLSQKSKLHVLTAMRQVLNSGVEWNYLSRSPAKRGSFKVPSGDRSREIRPFASWAEVEAVADAIGTTGPLVRFVCATGLSSPSEWIDLTPADFDLKAKLLIVHGTKTENRPRTIPLGARALDAVEDMAWPLSKTGRIFQAKRGGRFDYANWRDTEWLLALATCGLERRTPYEMRHTFATLALEAGASLDDVSVALGHSDITITRRYYRKWTRPMTDRLRGILDSIGSDEKTLSQNSHR